MENGERLIYRARNSNLSEESRKALVFTEIELVDKDIEAKSIQTRCKSNIFGVVNTIISGLILIFSGIIIFFQALSDCKDYTIIALSSLIFIAQGSNELFKLGAQGFFYKQATIRLRRLKRQTRDLMYLFHTFTVEQILSLVSQLRTEYDEIDLGLYKMTMSNSANYNTGFSISNNNNNNLPNLPSNTPVRINTSNNTTPTQERQHLHIHLDHTPPIRNLGIPITQDNLDLPTIIDINDEDFVEVQL